MIHSTFKLVLIALTLSFKLTLNAIDHDEINAHYLQNIQKEVQSTERQLDFLMIELLNDPLNDPLSPLHDMLIRRIGPMIYTTDLNEVDKKDLEWLFFFELLKYYKPGSANYNSLTLEVPRYVIADLYERFKPFLKAEEE